MELIDTHTHIYLEQFDEDREVMIQRAFDRGVKTMLLPNIDHKTLPGMNQLSLNYSGKIYSMIGLHPCSVDESVEDELRLIETELDNGNYLAIGETGIDLYWDKTHVQKQLYAFRKQIRWAIAYDLPLVIHARESFAEIFQVLDEENDERLKGVFHCFTGTSVEADKIIGYGGFKMGLGGVLTYKKSGLAETVSGYSLDHFVLETDAPFLSPSPHRGKRNEPSYLPYVAEKLAESMGVTIQQVAEQTSANAKNLFKLP